MAAVLDSLSGLGIGLKNRAQAVVDNIFPPEKRAEVFAKLQEFAVSNPKLSAFLLTNVALTGIPLLLFAVFTLTVFIFSLLAALLIALLAALLFTVFMVGVALIFILPTVFMTTFGASFIFLWGLGGYYIIKWFNEGAGIPDPGDALGDKLSNLTGGKLDFLMDASRKKEAAAEADSDADADVDEKTTNGDGGPLKGAKDVKKNVGKASEVADVDGVKKRTSGATSTVKGTAGTAKGAVSGVAGV